MLWIVNAGNVRPWNDCVRLILLSINHGMVDCIQLPLCIFHFGASIEHRTLDKLCARTLSGNVHRDKHICPQRRLQCATPSMDMFLGSSVGRPNNAG